MITVRDLLFAYDPYGTVKDNLSKYKFDNATCGDSNHASIGKAIKKVQGEISIIIEVGSWLGSSARYMAKECPKAEIVCVDTWLGSVEHYDKTVFFKECNNYEKFLYNNIHEKLEDRITPIRMDSVNAAYLLKRRNIKADVIYIDGGHEAESIKADIRLYKLLLRKDGVMILDDGFYEPILNAIHDELTNTTTDGSKVFWYNT